MPGSPPMTGIAGSTALSISGAVAGALSNDRVVMSGTQQALAADADDVAGDRRRAWTGFPGDGPGDVDRLAALRHRVHAATGFADAERDGLDHVGLDEAGSDRVGGDAVLGDALAQRLDPADDTRLGRPVVR